MAYWNSVWEVSGAYPAPRNATDEEMEKWVESVYWVASDAISDMKETSQFMANKSIDVVVLTSSAPNTYFMSPNQIKKVREEWKLEKEGKKVEYIEKTTEEWMEENKNKNEFDSFNQLVTEFVPDFAKFWAGSLQYLHGQV
uniref:Uncharacterized protein n=1 Tax=Ciona savignyi TaxID=51511 RepID=H2Y5K9_CIOSA